MPINYAKNQTFDSMMPCRQNATREALRESRPFLFSSCRDAPLSHMPLEGIFRTKCRGGLSLLCRNTPVPMKHPSTLLALFAAVFRPPTSPAFSKLPCVFLPLAALVVRTLADSSS